MRTKLELQRDPMWKTLFHKLTPLERDFIIEVSGSVRAEAIEDCAKVAEDFTVTAYMHWDEDLEEPVKRKLKEAGAIAEAIRGLR